MEDPTHLQIKIAAAEIAHPLKDEKHRNAIPKSSRRVTVGVLVSLTGVLETNERGVGRAALLAIKEINDQQQKLPAEERIYLVPELHDGKSSRTVFSDEADILIGKKADVIFGCWSSATRKTVLAKLEELEANGNDGPLLVYPVQYEGIEKSTCAIYLGALPSQQVFPAMRWRGDCIREEQQTSLAQHRCIMVGSDYIYPRAAVALTTQQLRDRGHVTPPYIYYVPLRDDHKVGADDVFQFDDLFKELVKLKSKNREEQPNLLLNFINGDGNTRLFQALKRDSWLRTITTISFSLTAAEVQQFSTIPELSANCFDGNDYIATTYYHQEGEGTFGKFFNDKCSGDWITTDAMWNVYLGVHFWYRAVREAGSSKRDRVRESMKGLKEFLRKEFRDQRLSDFHREHFPAIDGVYLHGSHRPVLLQITSSDDPDGKPVTKIHEPFLAKYNKTLHPEPFPEKFGSVAEWVSYSKRLWFAADFLPGIDFPFKEEMRQIHLKALHAPMAKQDWEKCFQSNASLIEQFYKLFQNPHQVDDFAQFENWRKKGLKEGEAARKSTLNVASIQDFSQKLGCGDLDFIRAVHLPQNDHDYQQFGLCGAKLLAFCQRQNKQRLFLFDLLDYALGLGMPVSLNGKPIGDLQDLQQIMSENVHWKGDALQNEEIANIFRVMHNVWLRDLKVSQSVVVTKDVSEGHIQNMVEYYLAIPLKEEAENVDPDGLLVPRHGAPAGDSGPVAAAMRMLFSDTLVGVNPEKGEAGCVVINNSGNRPFQLEAWKSACSSATQRRQFHLNYCRINGLTHTVLAGYERWKWNVKATSLDLR